MARTFSGTHPWITFELDLSGAPFTLWMDLGAIQSKIEHVAHAMLRPEVRGRMLTLYLAKGVHATTAIEGNTLSEAQVQDRIEGKMTLPESQQYLGEEIDNVVVACNRISDAILRREELDLTVEQIRDYNRTILDGLPLEEDVVPGGIRRHVVVVRGVNYRGAPAKDCGYLLGKLCDWLNAMQPPRADMMVAYAVLKAIVAHLYIAWIHPFGDGNGRTARLIELQILLAAGVPTVAAHLLSNHYNRTRAEYYRQLARASKSGGDALPFLSYAVEGLRDGLDEQIELIRHEQWDVAWKDYVYEQFRDMRTDAAHRRRLLALELSKHPDPLPPGKLRHLTPRLAEHYAGKTGKTLTRDINTLERMGLVQRTGKGVGSNYEALLRWLPLRHVAVDEAGASSNDSV